MTLLAACSGDESAAPPGSGCGATVCDDAGRDVVSPEDDARRDDAGPPSDGAPPLDDGATIDGALGDAARDLGATGDARPAEGGADVGRPLDGAADARAIDVLDVGSSADAAPDIAP